MKNYEKIKAAAEYICAHVSIRPTIGLVLGSGLDALFQATCCKCCNWHDRVMRIPPVSIKDRENFRKFQNDQAPVGIADGCFAERRQ